MITPDLRAAVARGMALAQARVHFEEAPQRILDSAVEANWQSWLPEADAAIQIVLRAVAEECFSKERRFDVSQLLSRPPQNSALWDLRNYLNRLADQAASAGGEGA